MIADTIMAIMPLTAGIGLAGRALLELYGRSAVSLGLQVSGEATRGSADNRFTAALGTPTLCGTSPVGGNARRDDEWCRNRHDGPARPGAGADHPAGAHCLK